MKKKKCYPLRSKGVDLVALLMFAVMLVITTLVFVKAKNSEIYVNILLCIITIVCILYYAMCLNTRVTVDSEKKTITFHQLSSKTYNFSDIARFQISTVANIDIDSETDDVMYEVAKTVDDSINQPVNTFADTNGAEVETVGKVETVGNTEINAVQKTETVKNTEINAVQKAEKIPKNKSNLFVFEIVLKDGTIKDAIPYNCILKRNELNKTQEILKTLNGYLEQE